MIERFIEAVESLTPEKVIFCLVVIVLAAFSLGFLWQIHYRPYKSGRRLKIIRRKGLPFLSPPPRRL